MNAFRTLVYGALIFLAAAAIWAVFDVDAAPWMALLALAAIFWPRSRRCHCRGRCDCN